MSKNLTCFIFIKYLTDTGCLSVTLNKKGDVIAAMTQRSFSEIKRLQKNIRTIIVAPTEYFSIYHVALPKLPDKKLTTVIPYALEDKLAEDVENLHFAFSKHHYHNDQYLVVICNKSYLKDLITKLNNASLDFDHITLDWFALKSHETCVMTNNILVHDTQRFCGALASELVLSYLKQISIEQTCYIFNENDPALVATMSTTTILHQEHCNISLWLWIAKRLQVTNPLNIIENKLEYRNYRIKTNCWYWTAITMSLLWLISLLIINGIKIHTLNGQLQNIDEKIAAIYRLFFPKAQQVISPRFRISQLLKSQKRKHDDDFWLLLNALTNAIDHSKLLIVEQLRFQNQVLQATIISKDFNELEALQSYLRHGPIKVTQTQASSRNDKVIAILELNL